MPRCAHAHRQRQIAWCREEQRKLAELTAQWRAECDARAAEVVRLRGNAERLQQLAMSTARSIAPSLECIRDFLSREVR